MNIELENCNNIDFGRIEIVDNRLNIKYALNGTGKSTIAKALYYKIHEPQNISFLQPFKYRSNSDKKSDVRGINTLSSICVFDENYVNRFVFTQDELIKDSYEIFIKDDLFIKHQIQIDELVNEVRKLFAENASINLLNSILRDFIEKFKATKTGWSKSGVLGKGLANGNKLENIPTDLQVYQPFLKSEHNVKWLQWQLNGNDYLSLGNCCPFCSSDEIESKKTIIQKVKQEYEPKYVEHLSSMVKLLESLSDFISEKSKKNLNKIRNNVDGISDEQKTFLMNIYEEIQTLNNKLEKMKELSFRSFKDIDDISNELNISKIDLAFLPSLNSDRTVKSIEPINSAIDELRKKAGKLKGEIVLQKKLIAQKIQDCKEDINSFLAYAGYNYHVDVLEKDEQYKLMLYNNDYSEILQSGSENLSYGERNAFALILFMYDVLKKQPSLIVLDDPISSFDGNKKFAILNKLFIGKNNFHDKTVLFLSHDFSVVIDAIYNLGDKITAKAAFLENKKGILSEKEIQKSNILSYKQIALKNISQGNLLTSLFYLRRLFEFEGEKDLGYQLLSNLFHKREIPVNKIDGEFTPLTEEEIKNGEAEINKYVHDFSYSDVITIFRDADKLIKAYYNTSIGYEKLQYYRLINLKNPVNGDYEDSPIERVDNTFKKFVNETFHIENDYLFQVNPTEYEVIPDYILAECDRYISVLKGKK